MQVWLHIERSLSRHITGFSSYVKDLKVELYLQFGYGMMEHCRFLVRHWGGGTVVLSPRDLSADQLERLGSEIRKLGGTVLLDPQLYRPDITNHDRLTSHLFWPPSGGFPTGKELNGCIDELIKQNHRIGARQLILPGVLAKRVDEDWLEFQRQVLEETQRCDTTHLRTILTVALSYDALRNDEQIQVLLDALQDWDVPAIYLVCEHPNGEYLVTDPAWLANCADIVAGIRLAGKEAIVGYCNHQMLLLSCSAASAITSGTWMNVRSFNADKFKLQEDEEIKQRSTWYYAPHLLSEYKVNFLDLAKKNGVLNILETSKEYGSIHADDLFAAPQPTLAGFTEQQAFRHYLQCLRYQANSATFPSFDRTIDAHSQLLDEAEKFLNTLHSAGIRGQKRDFLECVDANRGVVAFLKKNRASVLRRRWATLIE